MLLMRAQIQPSTRQLPAEPWGRKMQRAREDVARLKGKEAAELISPYFFTSGATISRLEAMEEVPSPLDGKMRARRQLAFVLLRAYRMDPTDFDLSDDDLPPGIEIPPRTAADLEKSPTIWFTSGTLLRAA